MPVTGTYETVENRPMVRFERTFPHPVQAVWEAVTDRSQLERWFPSTIEFESLEPGARIRFEFPDDDIPVMSGEVLAVEPERRLAFTWGDDELTFELEPQDEGGACRVRLTVLLDGAEKAARDAAGWDVCLDQLEQVAAGRAGRQPDTAPSGEWREYYEEYRRRGLPATAPLPE